MPQRVTKRFETLGEVQEDGSYKGRVMIMSAGFNSLAESPFGLGLGAVGLANRVNTGTLSGTLPGGEQRGVADAGYFNLILAYGVPGTVMLLWALYLAWQLLSATLLATRTA